MKQIFLDVEKVLSVLMAEIPEGVFSDDRADDPNPDNRSYSSSEFRAQSQMIADLYSNLNNIYANKFISTLTQLNNDGLNAWEKELFAGSQDASVGFDLRKQNLLSKKRALGSISLPTIASVVSGILTPVGLSFVILPYSGQSNGSMSGTWILSVSALGVGTYLGSFDPLVGERQDPGFTPLDCNLDYAAAGLTADQLAEIQTQAYAYEVRIYGMANADTLALLNKQLTALEPARSTHIITNNAMDPTYPSPYDFDNFVSTLFS